MTLGSGITLAAIGAVLFFAVDLTVAGIDIAAIGIILMVAGLAAVAFWMFGTGRRTYVTRREVPGRRETVVERERDVY